MTVHVTSERPKKSPFNCFIAAVGSFILGNDRWSLVRSFDPSFASGNSQWKNLLYDALWPISSRVIRNWHVLAQQKIVLAQRKIACARSQLELSFLVDRSQDLRLFPGKLWHLLWLLLFEEAFCKVTKLSVSILEADSVHLCHLQCADARSAEDRMC